MADSIKEAISNYEPRVIVLNVKIDNQPDLNKVAITLVVRIVSTNQITNIATSIERIR
jgi:phage baseplate assembly protein W